MTGRDETVAQARAFAVLLDELRAGKVTADTSKVLLANASAMLHELLAVAEGETAAGVRDLLDCECCDVSYPRPEIVMGLCPACAENGCGASRPAAGRSAPDLAPAEALPMPAADGGFCDSANPDCGTQLCSAQAGHPENVHAMHGLNGRVLEFWPAAGQGAPDLPWHCYLCGDPTGIRCWTGLTHPADIPACLTHSSATGVGDERECLDCAERRANDAAVDAGDARPPEWVCAGCGKRFPGRKPEDGRCVTCVPVPLTVVPDAPEDHGTFVLTDRSGG